MGKDKIRPENLGKLFLEIYKYTLPFNNKIIESLKDIDSRIKLPQDKKMMAELDFLHIYAIHNVLFNRFKSHYEIFKKNFMDEYRIYLREKMAEESALEYELDLLDALSVYMEKHNETLAKGINSETQIEFGRYISHRVIGDESGDDIRYITLLYGSFSSDIIELLRLIDSSIEIVE